MIKIKQIIIIHDPIDPARKPFELTMDQIKEFGETFFNPGFEADVSFTDESNYSAIYYTNDEGDKIWVFGEFIDEENGEVSLGPIFQFAKTFEESINELLDKKNMEPGEN